MTAIARSIKFIARFQLLLASIAVMLMVLHVCSEVASRAFRGQPIEGTIETVSYWYMIMVSFLPLAFVQMTNQNIRVDLLANLLPKRALVVVDLFANTLTLGVVALLGYASFTLALRQTGFKEAVRASTFDFPVWPARWVVVFSFSILAVVLLARLIALISPRTSKLSQEFHPEANTSIGPVE